MATRTVKLSWKKVCDILRNSTEKRCQHETYSDGAFCAVGLIGDRISGKHSRGYQILDRLPVITKKELGYKRSCSIVWENNDKGLTFKKNAAKLEKLAKAAKVYTKQVEVKV